MPCMKDFTFCYLRHVHAGTFPLLGAADSSLRFPKKGGGEGKKRAYLVEKISSEIPGLINPNKIFRQESVFLGNIFV